MALRRHFSVLACEPGFAFYHRMGGGIRFESERQTRDTASFLHTFDRFAVATGLMRPGMLYWAGEAREQED